MAVDRKDVKLPAGAPTQLLTTSHADFIAKYGSDPDDYEYAMSEFLRMNGIYWGVTAMDLMGRLSAMDRPGIVQFLRDCQTPAGGFRPVPGQDPHLLNTLSAVQVSHVMFKSAPGLRIRIHFIQIRIQHFRLNEIPIRIRVPIRIRIQSGSRALMTKN
jgi:prenyltransferase beta subunit